MPRTLAAELTAALDSGEYTPFFEAKIKDMSGGSILRTLTPLKFNIKGTEAKLTYQTSSPISRPFGNFNLGFLLTRGVTISGVNYTIDSSYFFIKQAVWDGLYESFEGSLLPNLYGEFQAGVTYRDIIEDVCTTYGKTAIYNSPEPDWLDYQFMPDGKILKLSKAHHFFKVLNQKYIIKACDLGNEEIYFDNTINGGTSQYDINPTEISIDYKVTERQFISRDEEGLLTESGNADALIWNLGYLESTDAHPVVTSSMGPVKTKEIAPHLKYLDFDNIDIDLTNWGGTELNDMTAQFEEDYDIEKDAFKWSIKVSNYSWATASEGGNAIPASTENISNFTPINTENFNRNLDHTVNTLQALAEAVDELNLTAWIPFTTIAPTLITSALDGTFTVTIASPAVVTKNGHGLVLGQKLRLTTTGALPTGLAINTDYFVIPINANTFNLATSIANARAGTKINTSGSQSGTHSIVVNEDPAYKVQFAGIDLSKTLRMGMPVRWKQNAITRYGFIATAPTFASSNTTFYILTICNDSSANYDVLNTGTYPITEFSYATPKNFAKDFPVEIEKWTLSFSDTNAHTASAAVAGTIYNPGGMSLWVCQGAWRLATFHVTWVEFAGAPALRFSCIGGVGTDGGTFMPEMFFYFLAASFNIIANGQQLEKDVKISTPTTYHCNVQCNTAGFTAIKIGGNAAGTSLRVTSTFL